MSGAHRNYEHGPATYQVSATTTGGQVMQWDSSNVGQIKPAGAGTVASAVAGVALADANPAGTDPTNPVQVGWAREYVAVAYAPTDIDVKYASAANPGDPLKCAASGQVTKYVIGTDTDPTLIIGKCTAQAAVASGDFAPARLLV
jgi:hypothetical protein